MGNNRVDMLGQARDAQWSALTFLGKGSVRVVAPAKVNLFLGVGTRYANGYHEVTTVMHTLALHDTLYVNCLPWEGAEGAADADNASEGKGPSSAENDQVALGGPNRNLQITITLSDKTAGLGRALDTPLQIPAAQNLVFKAIDLLARKVGLTDKQAIKVHIEKNIPSQAGLGGGSADAAAALLAMAHFWESAGGADAPEGEPAASAVAEPTASAVVEPAEFAAAEPAAACIITETARELGSDVAFFLRGGCGLYTGTGDTFQHALSPSSQPVIVVKPPVGVPTKEAYAAFDAQPVALPTELLVRAQAAESASQVPLFNNLAAAAQEVAPELASVQKWMAERLDAAKDTDTLTSAAQGTLLAGSGSATFALADSFAQASAVAAAAQARGWWARATTLSKLRAAVIDA